jgi:L-amino acid N-acyltransferase YncA
MNMNVRPCAASDISAICDIYNYYIKNTVVTFEEKLVSTDEMNRRFQLYTKDYPWFVCEDDGTLVGYAYATKWKEREAYRHTAEITVYLRNGSSGKGYGKALYTALIEGLRRINCHVFLGCIALPNDASAGLHEYFGFKKVAHFSEVGRKFDRWVDVGYWQMTTESI